MSSFEGGVREEVMVVASDRKPEGGSRRGV